MANTITTYQEFKTFILTELGSPVITVELADVHLQQCIDEAINDFFKYNQGAASYKDFIRIEISAGVSSYDLSGSGINDVCDILLSTGGNGNINALFSPINMMVGPADFARLSKFQLVDYHTAMMKLAEINDYFAVKYQGNFSQATETLRLIPTPIENQAVMLEVYKKESAQSLYNNQLVKKLAVARAMLIWGRILRKYSITLPGGGTLTGADILADGKEMYDAVIQLMIDESPPADFYVA
jgi:hypothetical protein